MLRMQACAAVPQENRFTVSALFPDNKSYYAYRCLLPHCLSRGLGTHFMTDP